MPSKPTHPAYHHGDLHSALVQAGLRVLDARGVEALTLREVAREAGVSHAAPYHHFSDKTALLAAIAEHGFHSLNACVLALEPNMDARGQLQCMALAYVNFAQTHRALFRLMFGGTLGQRTQFPGLYAASKVGFGALIDVISRGQTSGAFAAGDPLEHTKTVWSLMHGWTVLLIEDQVPVAQGTHDLQATTARRMDALMTGLLRR